jgi:hypothetical protein
MAIYFSINKECLIHIKIRERQDVGNWGLPSHKARVLERTLSLGITLGVWANCFWDHLVGDHLG